MCVYRREKGGKESPWKINAYIFNIIIQNNQGHMLVIDIYIK